jgi:hypothetical protein
LPDAEKKADPLCEAHIMCVVDDKKLRGKVEDIERGSVSKKRFYSIRWEDGELEHLTAEEAEQNCWVVKNSIVDASAEAAGQGKIKLSAAEVVVSRAPDYRSH